MALIECNECGRSVSDFADTCLGCGAPIVIAPRHNTQFESISLKYALILVIAAFLLQYVIYLGLDAIYNTFIRGTEHELKKGWLFLTLVLSYISIGVVLNIKLLTRLIDWHPVNATISEIFGTKMRAILTWPIFYPILIFQLLIV